jgi:hypothetical protein
MFWKNMPARIYLAKEEKVAPGHKAAKDRLTLLLGAMQQVTLNSNSC